MTTCYDAMCDLETMGTSNSAPIVSVAVTMFDIATETIGESFCKNIHLATAMRDGATPDAGTILWWMRQGDQVRRPIWSGGEDIRDVLRDLAIWIENQCGVKNVRPWGNSNRFDLGILESAYKRAHIPVPWYWSNERDFRTVRNLHPHVEYDPSQKGAGAHDPLVDCRFQIEHLLKIKRARRGQA
jgi:hypothetical protein